MKKVKLVILQFQITNVIIQVIKVECGIKSWKRWSIRDTVPIRLVIFSFFTLIVEGELTVLLEQTTVGLTTETRIIFSFLQHIFIL